jgi:single-strand DNA-binding protein
MSGETTLTVSGNLTANPKPGVTPTGAAFAKLRVASTARFFDRGEGAWRDGKTIFLDVTCWRRLGENVLATLERGDSVMITGRLRQRSYDDAQGTRHSVTDLEADSVGPDLSRYAAQLVRTSTTPAAGDREPVVGELPGSTTEIAAGLAA